MDIKARLNDEIKKFEDLKKGLDRTIQDINQLTAQKQALYERCLDVQGRIAVLQEVLADSEKPAEEKKPEAPAKPKKPATPLEVKQ